MSRTRLRVATVALFLLACSATSPSPEALPPSAIPRLPGDVVAVGQVGLVAMPEGRLLGGPTRATVSGRYAYTASAELESPSLPAAPDAEYRWRTRIDVFDLRSQAVVHSIDAGLTTLSGYEGRFGPLVSHPMPSPNDETVLFVRRVSIAPAVVRLDRYRVADGALLGSATTPLDGFGRFGEVTVVDNDRALLIRSTSPEGHLQVTWALLGADLSVVAQKLGDDRAVIESDPRTLAWTRSCSAAVVRVPSRGTWLTVCESSAARILLIVDSRTMREVGVVSLPQPDRAGSTIGIHASDARAVLLTDRPAVIRVDLASSRVIDARDVRPAASTSFEQYPLYVQDDRRNTARFSPDGAFAYVTQFANSRRFLTAISTELARVEAVQFTGQDVRAQRVSDDGERLYALVADARYADDSGARLVLTESRTLRELARSAPLGPPVGDIQGIASR